VQSRTGIMTKGKGLIALWIFSTVRGPCVGNNRESSSGLSSFATKRPMARWPTWPSYFLL
jgi:hypothetical protein